MYIYVFQIIKNQREADMFPLAREVGKIWECSC